MSLVVVATHPVQYHAPVYRAVRQHHGVPVHVIYGGDFSIQEHFDSEFRQTFAWDVKLVTAEDSCSFLSTVRENGARSVDEVRASGIGRELDRLKPEALLLTAYGARFYVDVFRAARRRSIPILFRGETTDHTRSRSWARNILRDTALRILYNRCARLLPIGARSRAHYLRLGCSEDRLIDSLYCVDTTPFRTDEDARREVRDPTRSELQVGAENIVVLFSGKLSLRKGPHLLIAAVAQLPPGLRQRAVVAFLGQGDQASALAAQAANSGVATRFIGFRNQTQLSRYYHAADLLALPSIQGETWGLVVNEALHHGLPVVVSEAVGSASDLVKSGVTGETAEPGSVASLSTALARTMAMSGPEVREVCRAKVGAYTVEAAAEGIARAYRELVGSRRPDPAPDISAHIRQKI